LSALSFEGYALNTLNLVWNMVTVKPFREIVGLNQLGLAGGLDVKRENAETLRRELIEILILA